MSTPATSLFCPKCTAEMRSYERSGVTVDMCTSCKGIFLDRGELDRLIDAEGSYYDSGETASAAPPMRVDSYRNDAGYREHDRYRDGRGYGHGGGKRRKSFLSELFD